MNGSVYPAAWADARGICDQPEVLVYLPKGTAEVVRRVPLTRYVCVHFLASLAGMLCPKDPVEYIYSYTGFQTV